MMSIRPTNLVSLAKGTFDNAFGFDWLETKR